MPEFFIAGRTYRHYLEDGTSSDEGLFTVAYVGTAPEPYEHYSETLGVAFGWQQGISGNGEWEPMGAYVTPDFAGWVEVTSVDDEAAVPDGCRWCGDAPGHHGHQFTAGIGLHQWAQQLADTIANVRMSTLQAAFRILGWPITFQLAEDDAEPEAP